MNLIEAIVEAVKLNKDRVTRPSWGKEGYIGLGKNSDIYSPDWCNKESGLLTHFMTYDDWEIYDEEKIEARKKETDNAIMEMINECVDESIKEMTQLGFSDTNLLNDLGNEFKEYMRK